MQDLVPLQHARCRPKGQERRQHKKRKDGRRRRRRRRRRRTKYFTVKERGKSKISNLEAMASNLMAKEGKTKGKRETFARQLGSCDFPARQERQVWSESSVALGRVFDVLRHYPTVQKMCTTCTKSQSSAKPKREVHSVPVLIPCLHLSDDFVDVKHSRQLYEVYAGSKESWRAGSKRFNGYFDDIL